MKGEKEFQDNLLAYITGFGWYFSVIVTDHINDCFPHVFDGLTGWIEDHIGNGPPSMIAGILGVMSTEIGIGLVQKHKVVRDEDVGMLRALGLTTTTLAIVGMNLGTEIQKMIQLAGQGKENTEMSGDIASGVLLGLVAMGIVCLPELKKFYDRQADKARNQRVICPYLTVG